MSWQNHPQEWKNYSKFRYVFRDIYSLEEQTTFDPGFCELANPIVTGQVFSCPKMVPGESYLIRLFDIGGRLVFSKIVKGGNDFSLERVQFNGLYFIVVSDNEGIRYYNKLLIYR